MHSQQYSRQARGPEMFYGYCHDSRQMRLMDYTDYMQNIQTGYSNLYNNPAESMQSMVEALSGTRRGSRGKDHGCGCGSRCGDHHEDCSCDCCIRCADVVEYARCGEVRRIPITFDNDTRRERDVTLELGSFTTESGQQLGWQASVSTPEFKLPPCGEMTVLVSVNVDCGRLGGGGSTNPDQSNNPDQPNRLAGLDRCTVAYATLRAEGCMIRPIVIAIAILPEHCASHKAGCGCGCCN